MKRFCESIKCNNELKCVENEIQEIESNISQIRLQLIEEEMQRKRVAIKEEIRIKQLNMLSVLINVINKIAHKNKLNTHLTLNSMPINQTIACYQKLFTPFDRFTKQKNSLPDEDTYGVKNSFDCNQVLNEIVSYLYWKLVLYH